MSKILITVLVLVGLVVSISILQTANAQIINRYFKECGVEVEDPDSFLRGINSMFGYSLEEFPPTSKAAYICVNSIMVQERANDVISDSGDAYRNDLRNN